MLCFRCRWLLIPILALSPVLTPSARASVEFTTVTGTRAATLSFDVHGDQLFIRLTNSSSIDSLSPHDLLTAAYFDIVAGGDLTPVSAFLAPGSTVTKGKKKKNIIPSDGNVGGEWAYANDLTGAPGGAHMGLSTVSRGGFKGEEVFPGPNLDKKKPLKNFSYGLLSEGDDPTTADKKLAKYPVIHYGIDFILSGLPPDFTLDQIVNPSVQFGPDTSEPPLPLAVNAPELSGTIMIAGVLMLGLMRGREAKRRSAARGLRNNLSSHVAPHVAG